MALDVDRIEDVGFIRQGLTPDGARELAVIIPRCRALRSLKCVLRMPPPVT